ncbi:MAG: hypothetical protein QNJ97_17310 [Myxococcota bacterium]|nr:hypothetical protein [Myxococcota bacterium]
MWKRFPLGSIVCLMLAINAEPITAAAAKEKAPTRQQLVDAYEVEYDLWKASAELTIAKRKKFVRPLVILGVGSTASFVVSIIMFKKAIEEDKIARQYHEKWTYQTNEDLRKEFKEIGEEAEVKRNVTYTLGMISASLGTAAFLTSVTLLAFVMPRAPEAPTPPPGVRPKQLSKIRVAPVFSSQLVGIGIEGRF